MNIQIYCPRHVPQICTTSLIFWGFLLHKAVFQSLSFSELVSSDFTFFKQFHKFVKDGECMVLPSGLTPFEKTIPSEIFYFCLEEARRKNSIKDTKRCYGNIMEVMIQKSLEGNELVTLGEFRFSAKFWLRFDPVISNISVLNKWQHGR